MGFAYKSTLDMVGQDLLSLGPNLKFGGGTNKAGLPPKAQDNHSMKAKKALARSRALVHLNKDR